MFKNFTLPDINALRPWSVVLLSVVIFGLCYVSTCLLLLNFHALSPFMLFFIPVILASWYRGFTYGTASMLLATLCVLSMPFLPFSRPIVSMNTNTIVELCLYGLLAIFISFIIDRIKNQDLITDYQKQLVRSHESVETYKRKLDQAQKEMNARDQFLAIASHELKTPVTSMLLQVQTAIHNIRNVSLANFSVANLLNMLEGTEQQSQRLSKMVNDLLNLSLITTGRMDLEPENTDMSKIVKEVADNFSEKLKKDNITLEVDCPKPVLGRWDKLRIAQAVTNLISNAIKYGNMQPIMIRVKTDHEEAILEMIDHGIGIAPEFQKKIFERFERAVSPKEYQGLGVGLYITNQIVRAHGGKIKVQSKEHHGTTFRLEIPLNPPYPKN